MKHLFRLSVVLASFLTFSLNVQAELKPIVSKLKWVQIEAHTQKDRTKIANMGIAIESVVTGSVWAFVTKRNHDQLKAAGINIMGVHPADFGRGGHHGDSAEMRDFPEKDAKYHNYKETLDELSALNKKFPEITSIGSLGKSLEGRNIPGIRINTTTEGLDSKPGIVFFGAHHAREHLSVEIPLMLAKHLLENKNDPQIAALLETRDIWIFPMVNPDGAEYDVATGKYRMWRKNRRDNGDGTFGVDLNRNYSFKWGSGGSSDNTADETYMGEAPFSEPETQHVRDFVKAHPNLKVLISFHTYSELILYPWGHTNQSIGNSKDLAVFQKMAKTMAQWNKYKPMQSSGLYIASGDTTDWAYGELGIFAFTFELSPKQSLFSAGFYPGPKIIDKTFAANLKPALYAIDVASDPYKVLNNQPSGWLKNYVEPTIPHDMFWKTHPLQ